MLSHLQRFKCNPVTYLGELLACAAVEGEEGAAVLVALPLAADTLEVRDGLAVLAETSPIGCWGSTPLSYSTRKGTFPVRHGVQHEEGWVTNGFGLPPGCLTAQPDGPIEHHN